MAMTARRLNPFFIRSAVRTSAPSCAVTGYLVLIPSSSGQPFEPELCAQLGLRQVLIPSSSGQPFERCARSHSPRGAGVLIPSSSGQPFEPATGAGLSLTTSLNPFFIRSAVRTLSLDAPDEALLRLNPFFIRSAVRTDDLSRCPARSRVLIPSSSGQPFEQGLAKRGPSLRGLNPFFIRSAVRTKAAAVTFAAEAQS